MMQKIGFSTYHAVAVMPQNSVRYDYKATVATGIPYVKLSHTKMRANAPSAQAKLQIQQYL